MKSRYPRLLFSIIASLQLSIVSNVTKADESSVVQRWYSEDDVSRGEKLFQQHCSLCHGMKAEGTSDWKKRDENGNFPPPPLNGTAHTWHHPKSLLEEYIIKGGKPWDGIMPPFGQVLDEKDAAHIIAYIQSYWSDNIYQKWFEIEKAP